MACWKIIVELAIDNETSMNAAKTQERASQNRMVISNTHAKEDSVEIGNCPLCLSGGASLHDSHFMPRSLYPLFRAGNLHPVRFSREKVAQTSEQVTDYVFCGACEKLFNRGGESWIHTLFARLNGPFPLRERLLKQAPTADLGDAKLYAAGINPEIDVPNLTHFGCGIFFKGSVHCWHGDPRKPYIKMERDEIDALRRYLFGKAALPKTMALCITIDSAPVVWQAMNEPYQAEPLLGFKRYVFYVPGIFFQLCIGDGVQEKIPTCINGSADGPVLYENISLSMRNTAREELKDAEPPQKLFDMMADLEKKGLSIRLGD